MRGAHVRSRIHQARRTTAVCSANSRTVEVCSLTSWTSAVIRPSSARSQPQALDRRRAVAGEGEHLPTCGGDLHRPSHNARGQRGDDHLRPRHALRRRNRRPRAPRSRARRSGASSERRRELVPLRRSYPASSHRASGNPSSHKASAECVSIGLLCCAGVRVGPDDGHLSPRHRRLDVLGSPSLGNFGLTFSGGRARGHRALRHRFAQTLIRSAP